MEKRKHFKFMGFLSISREAETQIIPKIWEKCDKFINSSCIYAPKLQTKS